MNAPARRIVEEPWPPGGLESVQQCPVCRATDRSIAYRDLQDRVFFCAPGKWQLYRCHRCRAHYLDPRPTPATIGLAYATYFTHHATERPTVAAMSRPRLLQRELANGYRNWRYGTRDEPANALGVLAAYALRRQRALMDSELRHLPRARRGWRVLDIGCGEGGFLQWAAAAGWETVGIDPDPAAVASARARGFDVRCGSVEMLHDERSSFDAVTLNHVIEHLHDPVASLRAVHNLLKPGGFLWIDSPNLDSTGHRRFGRSWLGLDAPRHLVLFTTTGLRQAVEASGLRVERVLSRFEVCDRVFAASHRIEIGQDPIAEGATPFRVRMAARLASWRAIVRPGTSEYATIIARRDR